MTAPSRQPPSQELIDRFQTYMENNPAGKSLHIVASDFNLDTECVQYCADTAKKDGDDEGLWLASEMLKLSVSQRNKLVRNRYGKKKPDGATRHECFLG